MSVVSLLWRVGAGLVVLLALARITGGGPMGPPPTPLPGAEPFPPAIAAQLRARLASLPRGHDVRTRHRNPDGSPRYANRLLLERSPYLLQHAHNPVDWYPWGAEAFARAQREDKPVLLSVGYSTCHWCHVMEEESFDDEEIAAYLNQHYVVIKVDREERPDVDGVYIDAVRLLTGSAGWPLTVWLTADGEPYYGGTYFPPRDGERGVRSGLLTLLERIGRIYHEKRDEVREAGADLARTIAKEASPAGSEALPTAASLRRGYDYFQAISDSANGGFGTAPKFPQPPVLELLLRFHRRSGEAPAREMVERTLDAMAAGGIYDHVGGGFHRYSTDARWRVPHFEKMLYDNAQLAGVYLDAYQLTGRPERAAVAREILAYVQREMTAPGGGFYTAADADSEGVEGKYFLWTVEEIRAALDPEQSRLVIAYYGVDDEPELDGAHVLHVARPLGDVAAELNMAATRAADLLAAARARLYETRRRRVPPFTDRKVVPAWNGLMISAFARAGQVLNEPQYTKTAEAAAHFVISSLWDGRRLRRTFIDGKASGDAFLDDYAFFIAALLDAYEASQNVEWLQQAIGFQQQLDDGFWDAAGGGYFFTSETHEKLLAREKPSYDGSEPAGNSVAIHNLLRLYEWTGNETYRERAEAALREFGRVLTGRPAQVPRMLSALDFYTDSVKEIVLVTPNSLAQAQPFLDRLRRTFIPNRVLSVVRQNDAEDVAKWIPLVSDKTARNGKPTAYVCRRRVCDLPTTEPEELAKQLAEVQPIPENAELRNQEGHGGVGMRRRHHEP